MHKLAQILQIFFSFHRYGGDMWILFCVLFYNLYLQSISLTYLLIIELIDIEGSGRLSATVMWGLKPFEDTIYIDSVPVIEYKSGTDGLLYSIR